jgi:hypothetical protein
MLLLVLKVASSLLTAVLAVVAMAVDLRTPRWAKLRVWCFTVLAVSATVSVFSQVVELTSQQDSTRRNIQRLLRLQTRLIDIQLEALFLASPDAIIPTRRDCLAVGNSNVQIAMMKHCSSKPPVVVAVGLCKAKETCHQKGKPLDFAATFSSRDDDTKSCGQTFIDSKSSGLLMMFRCLQPQSVSEPLPIVSLSDYQDGGLTILIDALSTPEYPNQVTLQNADLQWVVVRLNGVPISLHSGDFKNWPLENRRGYMHDLTSKELGIAD